MKSRKEYLKHVMVLGMALSIAPVYGQDFDDSFFNSEQIDISGTFQKPKRKSQADKMAEMRRKLEEQNEEIVRKKIEDTRIQAERELTKKIQNMLGGNANALDEVSTGQAGIAKSHTTQKVVETNVSENKLKVTPYGTYMNINGENLDYESSMGLGVKVSALITPHFDLGIGFSYAKFELEDDINSIYSGYNYFPGYYNVYGQGRKIDMDLMSLDIHGKYYIIADRAIKPYVGMGLGINRLNLEYEQNDRVANSFYSYYYGQEEFEDTYLSGILLFGTDIEINQSFGVNLEGRYVKGFGGGTDDEGNIFNPAINRDQVILNDQGSRIKEANQFSLNFGMFMSF